MPLFPMIGTSHGGLRKFWFGADRIPPSSSIGTSHGGLTKFGYEASRIHVPLPPSPHKGLELLMDDLESLCVCGD